MWEKFNETFELNNNYFWNTRAYFQTKKMPDRLALACCVSISSGQQNLMKTYHSEANTSRITKNALKKFLDFFGQSR